MKQEFGLHPLAVEDAQHGHQRPKIDEFDQSLFVVLHMIERRGDELMVGEVAIFVGANYVLSVRSRAERGFTDVQAVGSVREHTRFALPRDLQRHLPQAADHDTVSPTG